LFFNLSYKLKPELQILTCRLEFRVYAVSLVLRNIMYG